MPEVMLNRTRIMSLVHELIPATVAEDVGMHRDNANDALYGSANFCDISGCTDNPSDISIATPAKFSYLQTSIWVYVNHLLSVPNGLVS